MPAKIKIPQGMLKAAVDAAMLRWEEVNDGYQGSSMGVEARKQLERNLPVVLEAVVLWQRENVPVPSDEQWNKLIHDILETQSPHLSIVPGRASAVEWIRRMYDAPPESEEFTECDACRSKPGSPTLCGGCLRNRALIEKLSGRTTSGRASSKPEAPDAIKDLLSNVMPNGDTAGPADRSINERIVEAYRRGQRSK
jgi:hypothetical protein